MALARAHRLRSGFKQEPPRSKDRVNFQLIAAAKLVLFVRTKIEERN